MILTTETEEKLKAIAERYVNIFWHPHIEVRPGPLPPVEHLHFIYPLNKAAGNAADSGSLESMRDAVAEVINRRVGTMWVGVYGSYFHIWVGYRDE